MTTPAHVPTGTYTSLALAASAALVSFVGVAGSCAPMTGACGKDLHCAAGQVCRDGTCVDGMVDLDDDGIGDGGGDAVGDEDTQLDEEPADPSPNPAIIGVETVPGAVLLPGSAPRVFAGADGSVDIYFLAAPAGDGCGELWRAHRASDSTSFTLTFIEAPATDGCFVELDVARTADGHDHAVLRQLFHEGDHQDGSAAVTLEITGTSTTKATFLPFESSLRGLTPRVALDLDGVPHAVWAYENPNGVHMERTPLPTDATSELVPPTAFASPPAGVALTFDVNNDASIFVTESHDGGEKLRLYHRTQATPAVRYLEDVVGLGAVDAQTCNGILVAAYRNGTESRAMFVAPDVAPVVKVLQSGLVGERVPGDITAACDASTGSMWSAHQAAGALFVYAHAEAFGTGIGPNRLKEIRVDGAGAGSGAAGDEGEGGEDGPQASATVGIGGALSMKVIEGVAHIAYEMNGTLKYAVVAQ